MTAQEEGRSAPDLLAQDDETVDMDDVRYELNRRREDCERVRAALVPILREHPLSKDDIRYDSWGRTLRAGFVARSAAEVLQWYATELERLIAEVDLYRERDGLTRKALQHDGDGPLQFAALIVRQERDRLRVEVSRLREQLAAQRLEIRGVGHPGWPDPISFMWGANPVANAAVWLQEHSERFPEITVQRRFVTDWEAFDLNAVSGRTSSSEVEAPAQHKVHVWNYDAAYYARCQMESCAQSTSGTQAEVEYWTDQHEADTLRPQAFPDYDLTDVKPGTGFFVSKDDEGRPSGSGRLTPRPHEAVVENALSDALTAQYGFLPLNIRYGAAKAAREIAEQWLDSSTGTEDAAQAARSEATLEENVADGYCDVCGCPMQYLHEPSCPELDSVPSPSLRKEGEDA